MNTTSENNIALLSKLSEVMEAASRNTLERKMSYWRQEHLSSEIDIEPSVNLMQAIFDLSESDINGVREILKEKKHKKSFSPDFDPSIRNSFLMDFSRNIIKEWISCLYESVKTHNREEISVNLLPQVDSGDDDVFVWSSFTNYAARYGVNEAELEMIFYEFSVALFNDGKSIELPYGITVELVEPLDTESRKHSNSGENLSYYRAHLSGQSLTA